MVIGRLTVSLEEAYNAIIASNGHITNAANSLGIRPHTLKSMIDKHAELQAACEDIRIAIVDAAQESVYEFFVNKDLMYEDYYHNAKWVLEHLASKSYRKTSEVISAPKSISELTPEEREQLRDEVLKRIADKVQSLPTIRLIEKQSNKEAKTGEMT